MPGYAAQLVAVVGNRGCGKTTLTNQLSTLIPGYKTRAALTEAPPPASKASVDETFAALMAALQHCARKDMGAIVDSTLDSELLLVRHECAPRHASMFTNARGVIWAVSQPAARSLSLRRLRKGRISTEDAAMLIAYIAALQARVPLPHVAVFLDASPSSCADRCGLPEADLLELDRDFRAMASNYTLKGSAVYRRKWDVFGSVNQVRDTILCAEPQRGWSKTLAPILDADAAQVMKVRVYPARVRPGDGARRALLTRRLRRVCRSAGRRRRARPRSSRRLRCSMAPSRRAPSSACARSRRRASPPSRSSSHEGLWQWPSALAWSERQWQGKRAVTVFRVRQALALA